MHVLEVHLDQYERLVVTVESDVDVGGCPSCGAVAVGRGRRAHEAADAPCFGQVTVIRWLKRIWRWAKLVESHGGVSSSRVAGTDLGEVVVLDVDATIVVAHSEKENASPTF
jgi:hypothetical protein